jgi:hypothetical protein
MKTLFTLALVVVLKSAAPIQISCTVIRSVKPKVAQSTVKGGIVKTITY